MKAVILAAILTSLTVYACSSGKNAGAAGTAETSAQSVVVGRDRMPGSSSSTMVIPKALIYKTNGDWDAFVPVTLSPNRGSVVSYPAPSDVAGQEPVRLDGGFLLDRRGISGNSAFTKWTYSEYAALPTAPTPQEILANLIPDARVTEIYALPFAIGTPQASEEANKLIADSLKGCKRTFPPVILSR